MPQYLPDPNYTAERIAELRTAVEFAEYELSVAVALARSLGMSWQQLADALGFAHRAVAQQFAKRHKIDIEYVAEAEAERVGKLIGVGEKVARFEVREIASGQLGVSKVVWRTLSSHLKADVAFERARKRAGASVWRVTPDGKATELRIPPAKPSRTLSAEQIDALADW